MGPVVNESVDPDSPVAPLSCWEATQMVMAWENDGVFRNLTIAYPMFSEHAEGRNIRDPKGRNWGTDRWGYLRNGERWRYIQFSAGDAAGYEPTTGKQADLLDQVIDSACFAPDKNVAK
jgi:hypothetical protein